MTMANAIQQGAWHFARRVREEPPEAEAVKGGGHVRFAIGNLYATVGALSALASARDFGKPYSVQRANEAEDRMSLVLPYVRRPRVGRLGRRERRRCAGERTCLA